MPANIQTNKKIVRSPIVAVLGHVDHGKTTLLDAIRKTNVAAREAGAITQHIGAYQLTFADKKITFIDTPGHAAFETMRSRGAEVADVAVLVVAADDGVKQQTIEAVRHIRSAKIPLVVAINKIDLPQANIAKVKKDLAKNNVLLEGFGGNVPFAEISAKTGQGIENLLELINLTGELEELYCDPADNLDGVVIESSLDKNRGPVATVIITNGTLKIGDQILAGDITGKVRALFNEDLQAVNLALPSTPVEVLGLESVPPVGSIVSLAKISKPEQLEAPRPSIMINPLELMQQRESRKDQLPVIIKADVLGSAGAIIDNLPEKVWIIASGTGIVTEQDLLLAESAGAIIYNFNLKVPPTIQKQATDRKVTIKSFNIIYKLLEDVENGVTNLEKRQSQKKVDGTAKIIAEFQIDSQRIAGCKVLEGFLEVGRLVRLIHQGTIMAETKIKSMKQKTENVSKVTKGDDCGVMFANILDFQIGDSIELLPPEHKSEN